LRLTRGFAADGLKPGPFENSDRKRGRVEIDAAYVRQRLADLAEDEDLSKFVL
jgi:ATP-dependent protease HslVU (ClpYQ) ATPase subunit